MYIPDPLEILERQIEDQMDLVDENNTYPCCYCGRRFSCDSMVAVSAHPASALECGRNDCKNLREKKINES